MYWSLEPTVERNVAVPRGNILESTRDNAVMDQTFPKIVEQHFYNSVHNSRVLGHDPHVAAKDRHSLPTTSAR